MSKETGTRAQRRVKPSDRVYKSAPIYNQWHCISEQISHFFWILNRSINM